MGALCVINERDDDYVNVEVGCCERRDDEGDISHNDEDYGAVCV